MAKENNILDLNLFSIKSMSTHEKLRLIEILIADVADNVIITDFVALYKHNGNRKVYSHALKQFI